MKTLRTYYLTLLIAIFPVVLYSAGTTSGDFLLVDINAREAALAGIYAPYYAQLSASLMNPAAMQGIVEREIIFSHYTSVFGTNFEQLIYGQPLGEGHSIAGFFMYNSNGDLQRTDENGYDVEQIENYDLVVGSSYAFEFNDELNVGVNMKILYSKIYNNTNLGVAGNIGLLHRNYEKRYLIGVTLENVGINASITEEKSIYPMLFRAGYGIHMFRYQKDRVSLFVEEIIFLVENEGTETSFGLEVVYQEFFTARVGYTFGKDEGRLSLGVGVRHDIFSIDYAYQPYFVADNAHRFTASVRF